MKTAKGIRGNMTADPNKDITSIAYNHLNLPTTITFTNSRSISFMYDAGGNKLRKTVVQSGSTVYTQDYVGGIEYRNGVLESIFHAEGRITNVNSTLKYEYALKDHLGNTRIMFCDKNGDGLVVVGSSQESSEITQENHYYPFGLAMEGKWLNTPSVSDTKYTYNGKELNDDFGLNLYAYGARYYDASVARFICFDPIAEKFAFVTPYNYAENNPVNAIDLHGLQKFIITANKLETLKGENISKSGFNAYELRFSIQNTDGSSTPIETSNSVILFENKAQGEKMGNRINEGVTYDLKWHENSSFKEIEQIKIEANKEGENGGKTNIHPLNSSEMATDNENSGYSIGCKGVAFEKDATLSKDNKNLYVGKEHHYNMSQQKDPPRGVLEGFKKSREAMKEIRKVYEENKDKLQKEDNFELKVDKQQ